MSRKRVLLRPRYAFDSAVLWKDMRTVRDIKFDGYKPVLCGEMTAHLASV